ncbi:cation diffusion facilitator family transporter [Marinicaulis aureus]|uniref:Cation diffusion facilitator family transporter n=1 Tax=Hyphococcus aureus TaxID=2666033 RepID=A0ABW1KYY3_9PROT
MDNCTHQHHQQPVGKVTGRLLMALAVIVVFMVIEVVGGVISGSLALLADATHMLTDALALGLAASAQFFAARPADSRLHFGYRRAQVLAAFVNGVLLAILLVWIVFEAVHRFLTPVEVDATLMLWVAVAGFIANAIAFFILHRRDEQNLNMRGAMLHVVSDLLGSVAAIIAALVIAGTGWLAIDPILSIAVAFLIGVSALRLVRETGYILLEGAPANIDIAELETDLLKAVQQIKSIHNIQISQITPEQPRLTMHVTVADARDAAGALAEAKACLEKHYNIHHSTIQVEIGEECPDMGAVSDDAHEHAHNHEKAHRGGSMKTQSGAAAFAAD